MTLNLLHRLAVTGTLACLTAAFASNACVLHNATEADFVLSPETSKLNVTLQATCWMGKETIGTYRIEFKAQEQAPILLQSGCRITFRTLGDEDYDHGVGQVRIRMHRLPPDALDKAGAPVPGKALDPPPATLRFTVSPPLRGHILQPSTSTLSALSLSELGSPGDALEPLLLGTDSAEGLFSLLGLTLKCGFEGRKAVNPYFFQKTRPTEWMLSPTPAALAEGSACPCVIL